MNTGRALIGIGLVGFGVLLLLDQQGLVNAGQVASDWWPVLLLLAATLDLLARPARRASAVVLGVLGIVLLAVTTDVIGAFVWQVVWPLALVGAGVWLLFRRPEPNRGTAASDERMDVLLSSPVGASSPPRQRSPVGRLPRSLVAPSSI